MFGKIEVKVEAIICEQGVNIEVPMHYSHSEHGLN